MVWALHLQFDIKCVMCLRLSLTKDRHLIMGHQKNQKPQWFGLKTCIASKLQ